MYILKGVPFGFRVYKLGFICRAETRLWSPQVSEDGKAHPFKINLEAEPQVGSSEGTLSHHIFCSRVGEVRNLRIRTSHLGSHDWAPLS